MTQAWDRVERRKDNWTSIVKKYEPKIGFKYKDNKGTEYIFFGLVHADDDYYYGLLSTEGRLVLSSCVGGLEFAYEEVPGQRKCEACGHILPLKFDCRKRTCPERKDDDVGSEV